MIRGLPPTSPAVAMGRDSLPGRLSRAASVLGRLGRVSIRVIMYLIVRCTTTVALVLIYLVLSFAFGWSLETLLPEVGEAFLRETSVMLDARFHMI